MSQFYFICNKLFTEHETVVVSRGMPTLIDASVARNDEFADFLRSPLKFTWIAENHTPRKLQSLQQKDNVRKNRPDF